MVDQVRAQHEGSRFESDVFLAEQGVLPLQVARSAHVLTTRVEPEIWVPPRPGDPVFRVRVAERELALHFDPMEEQLAAGFSRDGQPIYLDLSFLDGRRGAHVNISGVSGVATKTTYASFLLFAFPLRCARRRGGQHEGARLQRQGRGPALPRPAPTPGSAEEDRARYADLGLPAGRRSSRSASGRRCGAGDGSPCPTRAAGRRACAAYFWTVRDVVRERLLRFMFAEAGDERSQIADLVTRVEARSRGRPRTIPSNRHACPAITATRPARSADFEELCELIDGDSSSTTSDRVGATRSPGTVSRVPAPARVQRVSTAAT